jgi:hypothetical protein
MTAVLSAVRENLGKFYKCEESCSGDLSCGSCNKNILFILLPSQHKMRFKLTRISSEKISKTCYGWGRDKEYELGIGNSYDGLREILPSSPAR